MRFPFFPGIKIVLPLITLISAQLSSALWGQEPNAPAQQNAPGKPSPDAVIYRATKAISLNPQDANAYLTRGIYYSFKRDYPKALEDLTKAIQLDPKNVGAYGRRGLVYAHLGNREASLADFSQAILLDPKDPRAYAIRGITYVRSRDLDTALLDLNQAIQLDSSVASPSVDPAMAGLSLDDGPVSVNSATPGHPASKVPFAYSPRRHLSDSGPNGQSACRS